MRPMQYHDRAAAGAEHKAGVLVLLIHIGSSALVLSCPLYNVPNFLCNESGMGIFKSQAFFSGIFHCDRLHIFLFTRGGTAAFPAPHGRFPALADRDATRDGRMLHWAA